MEAEKRKRPGDDREVDGKRAKGVESAAESKVMAEEEEDVEVEEFFAILKRIHMAVKYFEKSNVGGRKLTEKGNDNEWRLSFLMEDYLEGDNDFEDERTPEDSGLDLNLAPESVSIERK